MVILDLLKYHVKNFMTLDISENLVVVVVTQKILQNSVDNFLLFNIFVFSEMKKTRW